MSSLLGIVESLLDRFESEDCTQQEYHSVREQLQAAVEQLIHSREVPKTGDRVCWQHYTDGTVCGRLSGISALGFCTVERFTTGERMQIRIDKLWRANGN